MASIPTFKIGMTCYPTIGGSGILASALGEELARRGHELHFISYERPFRLSTQIPRLHFHPVEINDYGLFKYPDYTLPLSVKMAEVSRDFDLDILHVHYAVPHATAAILAQSMLPPERRPRLVTTLHGTDTTLLGHDRDYRPAIQHALNASDAVTAVSTFLRDETVRILGIERPIDVVHNFYTPAPPKRSRQQLRQELGIGNEAMLLHSSNLRPLKRIDLLLDSIARIRPRGSFKLVILAGEDFTPFTATVQKLDLQDRIIIREKVSDIEDYLQAADLGVVTSEMESFCLSILEGMCFACPTVAMQVGGIPEVIDNGQTGILVPFGNTTAMARAIEDLISNPNRRADLGRTGQLQAKERFSAEAIVPRYETIYQRVCGKP